jgi:N-methylhydantoinase B
MAETVDPFTFEIIRHKLFRVTEEAIIALESVSGTPITAEARDLMVSVYRADGGLMVGGVGFLQHMTSASQAVKHILASFSDDPGIFEDDVYLMNDPYSGALHAPDVYLISPIHWHGRLVGFVADFVHVSDIGGIDPGGFCPSATSCFQEGFASQGLKLVERGKLKRDVFETVLNVVRDPGMVGLDLKSLMAANHVAKQRMLKLYEDYGHETVDTVGAELIAQSERLLRRRLAEIPDGVWRARQYYERGEGTYRVELAAAKHGDRLAFDFTGTSEQLPIGINCSYWATWGAIFASILPVLAWDMVWNDGIFTTVELVAPEGTLVNALRPAPVSMATIGTVQLVRNVTLHALSKMVGASGTLYERATGTWAPTVMHYTLATIQGGMQISHHGTDTFIGAGGARANRDGVDAGGYLHAPANRCANVERHEVSFPHRYLYRRMVPDSGGPGKYRGGACHEFAVVPDGAKGFTAVLGPGRGMEAPMSQGIFGGYPGCNTASIQFRNGNASSLPESGAVTKGDSEDRIGAGVTEIEPDDIQYIRYDGGGGYGDPLDRDPRLVAEDVLEGLVTAAAAHDVYGVVLDSKRGEVNVRGTRVRRAELRRARLEPNEPTDAVEGPADVKRTPFRMGEYLQVCETGGTASVQCTWCGATLCPATARWKDHAVVRHSPPHRAGTGRVDSGRFSLLEFFCPNCGTALDVDIVHGSDPPLHDVIERWPEAGSTEFVSPLVDAQRPT